MVTKVYTAQGAGKRAKVLRFIGWSYLYEGDRLLNKLTKEVVEVAETPCNQNTRVRRAYGRSKVAPILAFQDFVVTSRVHR